LGESGPVLSGLVEKYQEFFRVKKSQDLSKNSQEGENNYEIYRWKKW
jgi:hypothetical protein